MLRWIKTFLIILCPVCLQAQIEVRGRIIDVITDEPVLYASVYIDGTTYGTTTDSAGYYTLKNVNLPCQIVFGHTSYFSKSFKATQDNLPDPVIFLTPKNIGVDEVVFSIKNPNLREKYLKLFKEKFLGDDRWGLQAIIENEDALRFRWEYDTLNLSYSQREKIKDSGLDIVPIEKVEGKDGLYHVPIRFTAEAKQPLKIVLPSTGYHLTYDLQSFSLEYFPAIDFLYWKYSGFCLYQAIEPKSNAELFKYKRNRLNAYYNSPMHLLRAMYFKKIRANGYVIVEKLSDNSLLPMTIENWAYQNNSLTISGNKGKTYFVLYHSNINGEPTNLDRESVASPIQSQIYFISDSCVIRENGTLVNNDILFRPFMGTKQIGASLPSDFKPGPGRL
jgi:hypothetical protein